jgi:hypothetical protein
MPPRHQDAKVHKEFYHNQDYLVNVEAPDEVKLRAFALQWQKKCDFENYMNFLN